MDVPAELITDRDAYLSASEALIDATLDVKLLQRAGVERLPELADAAAVMVARYADALTTQDRLLARGDELGVPPELLGDLRAGRDELAEQAERAAAWAAQIDLAARGSHPVDGA